MRLRSDSQIIKIGVIFILVSLCCVSCQTTTPQKNIDFHLVKITGRNEFGWLLGLYEFHNKNLQPIPVPMVTVKADGVATSAMVGFEILIDGKWKNPGYYNDGISPLTYLDADKTLLLEIAIPTNLWNQATPFRMRFSNYASSPSKLEDFQYK